MFAKIAGLLESRSPLLLGGVGIAGVGGSAYYLASAPVPVPPKLRTMEGKICRPVVPTSFREMRDYWDIFSTTKGLQTAAAGGACAAGLAGGAYAFLATRGVAIWWKRLFWRIVFIPLLSSTSSGVGCFAVLLLSVSTIRDKLQSVVTPVSATTEVALRMLLPRSFVTAVEFPQFKE